MSTETFLPRIALAIHEVASVPLDVIKADSNLFDDLALDSLDAIEVVIEIESQFALDLPDDELENVTTPGQFAALVEKHMAVAA